MRKLAIAAALLLSTSGLASANVVYNLSGVTLADGFGKSAGTLTGTFTTNDALSSIVTFDITASASSSFAGFEYTPANSTVVSTLPSQFFQLDSSGSMNELRLYFSSPGLTSAGGTISPTFSYEHEPSGGNRTPTGTVVRAATPASVPEPASLALLGAGMLGFGVMRRRRRR